MIQRYLGNKNSIAEYIIQEINRFCKPGDMVCDIFSGTVSMSMALKSNGYRVISNDISYFSYHFANCYLRNNSVPEFNLDELGIGLNDNAEVNQRIENLQGKEGFLFLNEHDNENKYRNLLTVLYYLENIADSDIDRKYRKHYFFNTYTEEGNNSYFCSKRGSTGHRRYFTPSNGRRLDTIMNKIREWYQKGLLTELQYSLLISIVCESVEKISNTQGTYHDFQRDEYDDRALNPLVLRAPAFDIVVGSNNTHIIGKCQDSLHFIKEVPRHSLIYIDPPYNFRQYTSYYFMLNLLSSYCEIKSLELYFKNVQFVRGQNMDDDFDSTFCKANLFIPSLRELITNAQCNYVVLSYYDGRNHENKGEQRKDNGISQIEELFRSDLFIHGSFELKAFERTNYQSFQGHSASKCKELLFIAEKDNYVDR